jgi:ADP-heptose:LPS heptosyltransferase
LVFQANPAGRAAATKSLRIEELTPLLKVGGVDWVVLQQGQAGRDLAAAHPRAIDALVSEISLAEFAAAVAATDFLVTVDTMAAHCAGAIGHPAWVAVPFNPHWYWGIGGTTTPWYPTLALFRQSAPRDWTATLRRIAEQLVSR